MVRTDNILIVEQSVLDAINALIDLFNTNNDFKTNTDV